MTTAAPVAPERQHTEVAVGILVRRADAALLLSTRPPGNSQKHDYPHALVRLHWCKVMDWRGDFEMREGQAMRWQQLPLEVTPVLPGALPVLRWLADERGAAEILGPGVSTTLD